MIAARRRRPATPLARPVIAGPAATLQTRGVRARFALAAGTLGAAVVWACAPPPAPPLAPAGTSRDDGTGQLARASVRLRHDGIDEPRPVRAPADRGHLDDLGGLDGLDGLDGLGLGGLTYGGLGYGGVTYGGWGLGFSPRRTAPPAYQGVTVTGGGSIEGAVRWRSGGGVAWPPGCAVARVARAGTPVAGAVVYLEGVRSGRAVPFAMGAARTGGVAVATACAIVPTTQVAGPLPVVLLVENADRERVRLHHERPGGVTTLTLDPGGRASLAVERAGETRLWDGARAPAWVLAQPHPYQVVTGDDGRFALDEVPAGTWELVVWYPPLVVALGADGPVWGPPTVERRRVTVPRSTTVRVAAELTPAR